MASIFKPCRVVPIEHFPPLVMFPILRFLIEPNLYAPSSWVPFGRERRVVPTEAFPPPAMFPMHPLLLEPNLYAPGSWVPFAWELFLGAASVSI